MRVDNPRFERGFVQCEDCPFACKFGGLLDEFVGHGRCGVDCPTPASYAEDCELAAKAVQS